MQEHQCIRKYDFMELDFLYSIYDCDNKLSGFEGEALAAGTANATRRFINEA